MALEYLDFQIIVTITGFVTAGLTIHAAFKEWHVCPVITTLDSIAAPVTSIQFPTVTVCQEEFKKKDNWAILENILNFVAFECADDLEDPEVAYSYKLASCNETLKVRQDFQFSSILQEECYLNHDHIFPTMHCGAHLKNNQHFQFTTINYQGHC